MTKQSPPRILVVDDEEAILETMTFTFMDDYEVLTSTDAGKALRMLDENAPVAVVITDQRMPDMTGVEFLAEVVKRHPETVRILLTGFADMEATVQAINEGRVYAYVNKPWEPDELKQMVRRAVEHHELLMENQRLVEDLRRSNLFLGAMMDRLDTGAMAIDAEGVVRATNASARRYLNVRGDGGGERHIREILRDAGVEHLTDAVPELVEEQGGAFEDVELRAGGRAHKLRMTAQRIAGPEDRPLGLVVLFKEVSHEPLRRRFEEIVHELGQTEGELRPRLEEACDELEALGQAVRATGIASAGMAELAERVSRTQTAIQNWLDVDESLAREEFPDAQLLLDRLRVASERWPYADALPARVKGLVASVEAYYESGENTRQRVL